MTTFLRLLADKDKANNLAASCFALRTGVKDERVIEVEPGSFAIVPGSPFSYWASNSIRSTFQCHPPFEGGGGSVRVGLATADDFRFLRTVWEPKVESQKGRPEKWPTFAKGGAANSFYLNLDLVINWGLDGQELKAFAETTPGTTHWSRNIRSTEFYFQPGITWPLRARKFSPQVLPKGSIFSVRGYSAFPHTGVELATLALFASSAFDYIYKVALGRFAYPEFIVGILQKMPWPSLTQIDVARLSNLARRGWSLKRTLDAIEETSHAFVLPAVLRGRLGDYGLPTIEAELVQIQAEIDEIAFGLYGFSESDRAAAEASQGAVIENDAESNVDDEGDEDESAVPVDQTAGLLSWAVGVAFGRFDWRLATGDRAAPAEPEPFDPLPAKSPGMLPDGAEPFHAHAGILVDDQGHPHDLARLVEEVLNRVDASVPDDVRRWLRKDFFAFHLQRYSKSRRKAPIYWPLSTASGSYTLWVYYPSLNNQTLFTAVNDFLDGPNGKLTQVSRECTELRIKGSGRSRDEEKQFEALQTFEQELTDLRDTLLKIAPTYQPNHDDGVQITAASLWPLFRHKAWQKVLKDTWAKLEKGNYDWAHLAMTYWPERVREKCKTDKSLAIAHGLEDLYIEPEKAPKKTRGKKKAGANA